LVVSNTESRKLVQRPKRKQIQRLINHPLFHQFTVEQAERYLAEKPPGDFIYRPSSRGVNYLTISWKFYKVCRVGASSSAFQC
jgi:transcription elongation factor SPT6